MGAWDEAAGEEIRTELEEGEARRADRGPLRPQAPHCPVVPWGCRAGASPPPHSSPCVRVLHTSMSYFPVSIQRSFIPFAGFVGKQQRWGGSQQRREPPLEGVGHGSWVLGRENKGAGRQSSPPPGPAAPIAGLSPNLWVAVGLCREGLTCHESQHCCRPVKQGSRAALCLL